MKNDSAIKKHHFWLLLGFVPLFTLIGALMVSSSVGGAIANREKEIDGEKQKIAKKTNPKSNLAIAQAAKLVETVSGKQGDLHRANWDRQKNLFTWPANSKLLKDIERGEWKIDHAKLEQMDEKAQAAERERIRPKFGEPLPNTEGQFDEFKRSEVYIYQFSSLGKNVSGTGTGMADRIAPTQFKGGWRNVLRYVNDFGQGQITSEQVWLIMEDIWIQRSMLDAVRSINEDTAVFHRAKKVGDNVVNDSSYDDMGNKISVDSGSKPIIDKKTGKFVTLPTPEDEKRKALFRNRIWSVELELVRVDNGHRLIGTLTNESDRLQLMGENNIMTLNVWFKDKPEPFVFKIGGEFVPGKGATKTTRVDGKEQTVPASIHPIVQTKEHLLPPGFDGNEISRVEQVFDIRTVPVKRIDHLVLGFLDSRHAAVGLQLPEFIKETPPPGTGDPNSPTPPGGTPPGGTPPGGTPPGGTPPGGPKFPFPGSGPFPPGFDPKRSASGVQAGSLMAVIDGNKKRYLEVPSKEVRRMPVGIVLIVDQTQIQDVLLAFANSPLRFQITQVEWKRFRDKLEGIGPGSGNPTGEPGVDYGNTTVNFGGPADPDSRPGRFRPTPFQPTIPPRSVPGSTTPYSPYGRPASTVSESQITSGLVELSIYGIVSLYEKWETPKVEGATTPQTPSTPTPGPGQTPTPGQTPSTPTPKSRRRVRK